MSSGFGGIKGTRGFFLSDKRFSEDLLFFIILFLYLILYITCRLNFFIANKISS